MIYNRGLNEHGDSYDALQRYTQQFQWPAIIRHHRYELIKELNLKQTDGYYVKAVAIVFILTIKHLFGNGLLFSEGSTIEMGCHLSVKLKPNHFKQQFYENPFEFDPDRWRKYDALKINPYSFFLFSSGSRICTGQHITLLQTKLSVIFLIKKYGKITLQKQNFKKYIRTFYAAQRMTTTFQKIPQ